MADVWLEILVEEKLEILELTDWWHLIDEVRSDLLICLLYNVDFLTKFPLMVKALENGDYEESADQLEFTNSEKNVYSEWYHQVGHRAPIYIRILRTGIWE